VKAFFSEDSSNPNVVPAGQAFPGEVGESNIFLREVEELKGKTAPDFSNTIKILEGAEAPTFDEIVKAFKEKKL
jgi:hypothetical protein